MKASSRQYPTVLLESFSSGHHPHSFRFDGLQAVIAAQTLDEVIPALGAVEQAVGQGLHAAGFVSYEAASALNPDLPVARTGVLPLVWFGIFSERHPCIPNRGAAGNGACHISPLETASDEVVYARAVAEIRAAIAAGETYQVNFTTRQHFNFDGDPFALYRRMCLNQSAPFCAWLDTGTHRILSASPELFFSLQNSILTMRPMKGTTTRMPFPAADLAQRDLLAASAKERAENLMIVDLVRNDLSTIAETGSVAVPALFEIETYPTVHQMTSTVTAKIRNGVGLADIFRALFPCGSVTGAPKRRTMEIIRKLEQTPRGIYCGAIGYLSPGPEAVFSVAIRTAVLDMASGTGEIGIGSGITWDSDFASEYRECLAKSVFLAREHSDFNLIEALRHDCDGYLLLERHLQRLAASAAWFGFPLDTGGLRDRLDLLGKTLTGPHKVRVLLAVDGTLTLEAEAITGLFLHPLQEREWNQLPHPNPLPEGEGTKCEIPALVAVTRERVDSTEPFLFHKTTCRDLFERERQAHPGCYDVIFLNERDELAEGSYNNIVVSLQGELLTPALPCGLLPGVLRGELLDSGAIREAILTLDDLHRADKVWLINSVRGWRECQLPDLPLPHNP